MATTITGRELNEAAESAMLVMAADARLVEVEVTVPLTERTSGRYAVSRSGSVRRLGFVVA